MVNIPERICIWESDKTDQDSCRGWTTSFPNGHPHEYVRADIHATLAAENEQMKLESKAERLVLKALNEGLKAEVEQMAKEFDELCAEKLGIIRKPTRTEASAAVKVTDAIGVIDTLIESLSEGLMTDAGLTKADRSGMKYQITALELAKDIISTLTTEPAAPQEAAPVAVVVGHHVTQGPNVEFLTDNIAVGTKLYTHPPAQEVTEAQVEAALVEWFEGEVTWSAGMAPSTKDQMISDMRAALTAAQEAGR